MVLGKLRVIRSIGEGGMGMVYEVEHVLTKHRRALKILRAGASPRIVERFVREASAAARIGNPHVAETFDAGTLETGEPYLLMELLEGATLDQRLRRGPLAVGDLAEIVCQACEGVQAAHDAGIVHRDLKPENLFLTVRDGAPFVRILDFGISKFDEGRTGALGITEEGSVMGTPFYMSPEQVRASAAIDARTDIYALGVMLYECSCGVRPYDAEHLAQLAVLIHEGKPLPLQQRQPALPAAFCDIVSRAMSVDRDRRQASARALADELAPFRSVASVAAVIGSTPPSRIVVRPSQRPAGSGAAPAPPATPSMDAALAATLAKEPAARRRGRANVLTALGVAVFVGAAGIVVATRSGRPGAAVASPTESAAPVHTPAGFATGAPPPPSAPSPVESVASASLVPLAPPVPCASAAPGAPPARSAGPSGLAPSAS
jgi:eukaryotic-like serine/threonine-protein kinase